MRVGTDQRGVRGSGVRGEGRNRGERAGVGQVKRGLSLPVEK